MRNGHKMILSEKGCFGSFPGRGNVAEQKLNLLKEEALFLSLSLNAVDIYDVDLVCISSTFPHNFINHLVTLESSHISYVNVS
jgi:hypothetical protein